MARTGKRRRRAKLRRTQLLVVGLVVASVVAAGSAYLLLRMGGQSVGGTKGKPIILYVNQGNGKVNGSGFGVMLDFAAANGFNTIFFQVYREGNLLFSPVTLQSFVNQTHQAGLKIFFALYITSATQALPTSIFGLHEDGVSLDMSTIDTNAQQMFLRELESDFSGETAATTQNMSSTLKPDLLILETYAPDDKKFIEPGIIASVEAVAVSNATEYASEFQYALQNSDGVMVFDYAGLLKTGYYATPAA
jgi:hypothetical protein